jgi:hypothetical protein
MRFISHRGNLAGCEPEKENLPSTIDSAIGSGFDCEIDLWLINGSPFLGHDVAETIIATTFLLERSKFLWIHCKNVEAIMWCKNIVIEELNYFWHQQDKLTITSRGFLWVYPGNQPVKGSVAVLPEIEQEKRLGDCFGICSDYIVKYKVEYEEF